MSPRSRIRQSGNELTSLSEDRGGWPDLP